MYQTIEDIEAAIRLRPTEIQFIENPSKELCLLAAASSTCPMSSTHCLQYIEQDEDVCFEAIKALPTAIRYINNPTKEMIELAVSLDGFAIEHIKEQTEELAWLAIKPTPRAIISVINPTEQMIEYAVMNDPGTFIDLLSRNPKLEQVEHLCKYVVFKEPSLISFFESPSYELMETAIRTNPYNAIVNIKNVPEELAYLAWTLNSECIKYLKNATFEQYEKSVKDNCHTISCVPEHWITEELSWIAIKGDPSNIKYVNPTEEMCQYAIDHGTKSYILKHIPKQYLTEERILTYLQKVPIAIKHIEKTEERCFVAVKLNGRVLNYIENQSIELVSEAVKQCCYAIEYAKVVNDQICHDVIKKDPMCVRWLVDRCSDDLIELAVQMEPWTILYLPEKYHHLCPNPRIHKLVKLRNPIEDDIKRWPWAIVLVPHDKRDDDIIYECVQKVPMIIREIGFRAFWNNLMNIPGILDHIFLEYVDFS